MAEEKPVLTWLMTGDNNVNEETEVLTELEKRLNMDINIIYINGRDFETKLNTMIAGGCQLRGRKRQCSDQTE